MFLTRRYQAGKLKLNLPATLSTSRVAPTRQQILQLLAQYGLPEVGFEVIPALDRFLFRQASGEVNLRMGLLQTGNSVNSLVDFLEIPRSYVPLPQRQAISLLRVALGADRQMESTYWQGRRTGCATLSRLESELYEVTPGTVSKTIETQLALPAVDVPQLIARPFSLEEWLRPQDSRAAEPLTALRQGQLIRFFTALTDYCCGLSLNPHPTHYDYLKQLVAYTYGYAPGSADYEVPDELRV